MTLIELMVATFVLSMVGLSILGAFQFTGRARDRVTMRQERDHVARTALMRISRDVRSAFLSAHLNPANPQLVSVMTAFVGADGTRGDRLDFTTFSHRRLRQGAHEGDACEVGYRVEARRDSESNRYDLVRREAPRIDTDPLRGGTLDVMVEDVAGFDVRYYDPSTDQWTDSWDTQGSQQSGRLPARVQLSLRTNERDRVSGDVTERTYRTETPLMIRDMLRFGLSLDFR